MPSLPVPLDPVPPNLPVRAGSALFAVLRQIDGWGEHGWRRIHGAWRLGTAILVCEPREGDGDPLLTLILPNPQRDHDREAAVAIGDWALDHLRRAIVEPAIVRCATAERTSAVRASTAAAIIDGRLCLRLLVRLPSAGLCCDGARFARFIRRLARFARELKPDGELRRLRRCLAVQQALRAALPRHGLVAFLAEGSRLARTADGGPAVDGRPLRVPKRLAVTIDLGTLGRWRGLGIRAGVTALIGAPYHGKSTLVQAIAAGRDDHRPGDGREGVVCRADAILVQAEEGRRITSQDVRPFFARLPAADVRRFSSARASGATSMAATLLQGVAAGCRVLLIDEDTAAGNFLWLDPAMRRLLGRSVSGGSTLCDRLRAMAGAGISTVLAVGSATPVLGAADRVLRLESFQPRDATARARRLAPRLTSSRTFPIPIRRLTAPAEMLLEGRHFVRVDARRPDQPVLLRQYDAIHLDLRRCGVPLDEELSRGALAAAAWCLRLAEGRTIAMTELGARYAGAIAQHGPRACDPFATTMLSVAPWPLVVLILERLPGLRWR